MKLKKQKKRHTVHLRPGAPAEIFSGGQAMYLLSTGSNKTLQLQPEFC